MAGFKHPVTPDGRYFVVRGKLWYERPEYRSAGEVAPGEGLMAARRAVKDARGAGDHGAEHEAHRMVDEAKRALGERGPVWWERRRAGPQQARR
jgi:hypothetical protein